MKYPAHVCPCI